MRGKSRTNIALMAPFPPLLGGMAQLADSLATGLAKNGHGVVCVDLGKGRALGLPLLYLKMFNAIRKVEIVQIISASGRALVGKDLPALILASLLGKKAILQFVGGGAAAKVAKWGRLRRLIFSLADRVVVPTALFRNELVSAGIEADFEVIPHVVNIDKFGNHGPPRRAPVLLSAKGLSEYAGFDLLIDVFQKVRERIGNAELWIAGDGPERKNLEDKVARLGIQGVLFLGGISNDKMPQLLGQATIFVHGTRLESFGIALVEAMASGLPVVAFSVGGIPEVVIDKESGFLVPYGSVSEFAARVADLLGNEDIRSGMSRNALAQSTSFGWARIGSLWEKLYLDLEAAECR